MTLRPVCCPQCKSDQVVKRGKTSNEKQRYLCQNEACPQQTFVLEYRHRGCLLQVKRQIIDLTLNGSGMRDTVRGHCQLIRMMAVIKASEMKYHWLFSLGSQGGSRNLSPALKSLPHLLTIGTGRKTDTCADGSAA